MSEWSYDGLAVSPCRYSGSVYLGDMVICAHNYNTYFGRLATLKPEDEVYFTDMSGNRFVYSVGGRARVAVRCVREN